MDISTVAGCFDIRLNEACEVTHARLAFGGVAAMPARARKTEEALLGQPWNEATIRRVLPSLDQEFTPISDVRGTAGFRQRLIGNLLLKFAAETLSLAPDFSPVSSANSQSPAVLTASSDRETVKTVPRAQRPHTTEETRFVGR